MMSPASGIRVVHPEDIYQSRWENSNITHNKKKYTHIVDVEPNIPHTDYRTFKIMEN